MYDVKISSHFQSTVYACALVIYFPLQKHIIFLFLFPWVSEFFENRFLAPLATEWWQTDGAQQLYW